MRGYWIKIFIGAFLIFGVGFAAYASVRRVVRHVDSDHDLTIPLGSFIPFSVGGDRLGTLRSLTIRRSAPHQVSGFAVRARVNDPASFERLRSCRMSVTDPERINERTMFLCLGSDSGYQEFGEVRLELRVDGNLQTLVQPLLLPTPTVQEILSKGSDSTGTQDSMAAEIRERVRVQSRSIADSIRAEGLEERARQMQRQADSIRAARKALPPKP
jgi:hypothetical protein